MSHNIIVILICLALAAWSLYREYRRELKRYLWWRILAVLIAITAIGCLILPVTYWGNNENPGNSHVLLTPGFSKDSLQIKSNDSIYTLDRNIQQQFPKAKLISDLGLVSAPLEVFGYGLTKEELDQLGHKPIKFHPSPVPDGIISASWTDQIKAGEVLTVQLKYKKSSKKKYKLLLNGFNTTVDSATVQENAETNIMLQTKPKSIGKMIYSLFVVVGKDTLQKEDVPVFINAIKPLSVLMLSASPDFETRFLKSWLGENGYGVASRSIITKGKFSQEFINLPQTNLNNISAELLNKFDLLISDQSSLRLLNSTENSNLQQAVFEKGMGVVIRADSAEKSNSWWRRNFNTSHVIGKQPTVTTIYLQESRTAAKLAVQPIYINQQDNIQLLAADEQQHILVSAALAGRGKLVFNTINDSYKWLMNGDKSDYYALWSLMLNKAAPHTPEPAKWTIPSAIPAVYHPLSLTFEGGDAVKNTVINGTQVFAGTDVTSLFAKNITYWPEKMGWQQVATENSRYNWYVWGENDWKGLKSAYKLTATSEYCRRYLVSKPFYSKKVDKRRRDVPKIYFFVLFLVTSTFLWAERKFFNT